MSPQKNIGMDGIGAVMTSSPTSSTNGSPVGVYDSTRAPNARQEISPRHTGTVGAPPTLPVHRSVPPEKETIGTRGPTWPTSQSKPLSSKGEPVEPMVRSEDRSTEPAGSIPAFWHAVTNAADTPKWVI